MKLQSTMTDKAAMEEIGRRLQRRRIERGFTQAELAAATGISRPTVDGIESGRRIQSDNMIRVLRGLGLLEALGAALPEGGMGPLERLETKGAGRRRVRHRKADAAEEASALSSTWRWGDER